MSRMTPNEALRLLEQATKAKNRAAEKERDAILACLHADARQVDIAQAAGLSRERVRQIARDVGITGQPGHRVRPAD